MFYSTLINRTQYTNIYGLYTETGKCIGTKEVIVAGRDCGTYFHSWYGKYNKRDIKKLFKDSEVKNNDQHK